MFLHPMSRTGLPPRGVVAGPWTVLLYLPGTHTHDRCGPRPRWLAFCPTRGLDALQEAGCVAPEEIVCVRVRVHVFREACLCVSVPLSVGVPSACVCLGV